MSVRNNFIIRFDKIVSLLAEDADMFPFFDKARRIQKSVLTKHNILYFKQLGETVVILTVFDTRQNPEKLTPLV